MSHRRTDTPANDDLARVELLHEDERVRRAAIRKVFTPAGRWSLRTALRLDPSARVRAEAAEHMARLGAPQADELAQLRTSTRESLCDALDDERPLVRHEALRALARLGEIDAYDAVERVATTDTLWWIRRTAVIAMSALGGIGARGDLEGVELRTERLVHALRARLDDPAWRVRHAVVQELEPLALESDAWREKVLAPLANAPVQASTALAYLAAQLSGVGEVPRTLAEPPEVAHPLQDPDPAVVAARLARLGPGEIAPRTLVPWLADPHVTLRSQAIRRLADSGDEDAIRHAFHWLDEPRIPYVHDAIRELLDLAPWARALLPDEAPAPEPPPSRTATALAREDALRHPDPLIRLTALDRVSAREALSSDPDPSVRRQALGILMNAKLATKEIVEIAIEAARAIDPWLRAHAALVLDPSRSTPELDTLLVLSRDHAPAVRASVLDRFEGCDDLDERLREALTRLASDQIDERRGAYLWLLRTLEPAKITWALEQIERSSESPAVATMVREIAKIGSPLDDLSRKEEGEEQESEYSRTSPPAPLPEGERGGEPELTQRNGRNSPVWLPPLPFSERGPRGVRLPAHPVALRPLGRTGIQISPIGFSGSNEPLSRVFHVGREAGANLFFWEPGYQQLSKYLRESRRDRDQRVVVSGTYHADAASFERDVDTALRRLKLDRLDVFLLFWVRSRARIDDEAFDALSDLKRRGKIRAFGFSTHHRDIAHEALEARPWDVLMLRHSAAHRGAERTLLPEAARREVGVLTFTNVCYGRLIRPVKNAATQPLSAEDCYRYTLSQPGVSACWSAPRRYDEVLENVRVLDGVAADDQSLARMRAHGDAVYAASQRFNALIRQAPTSARRGVRTIALERLDGLEIPADIAGTDTTSDNDLADGAVLPKALSHENVVPVPPVKS